MSAKRGGERERDRELGDERALLGFLMMGNERGEREEEMEGSTREADGEGVGLFSFNFSLFFVFSLLMDKRFGLLSWVADSLHHLWPNSSFSNIFLHFFHIFLIFFIAYKIK